MQAQVNSSTAPRRRVGKDKAKDRDIGVMPHCLMLNPRILVVDDSYQRDERRHHTAKIVREFHCDSFRAPSVSMRADGTYAVYDGQHTVLACIALGFKLIPCMVRQIASVEAEAAAFLGQTNTIAMSRQDKHRAAVALGDPAARMVQSALSHHGVEITKCSYGPRKTTALSALYKQLGKPTQANKRHLEEFVGLLLSTWSNDEMVLSGRFVEGMGRLLSIADRKGLDVKKVLARLGKFETRHYLSRAEGHAKSLSRPILRTLVDLLAETHDHKLRDGRFGTIEQE
jgi:hypothetical protein